ncbi:MAG TPA: class I SAM-dependent methyltransferase [Propionicimonas sp.]|nr:class I SAM-dependent methyltransferase [Propionicimonas sp.]
MTTPEETAQDYLAVNRANWDTRAPIHAVEFGLPRLLANPAALSDVVSFDAPRLGDLTGLDVLHLQCHIGTDTLSLARLGGRVTGLDLSPASLAEARTLAARAGVGIDYVEADVYSAPAALGGATFDLVYTGIGALCWLPSIRRWAQTVAALLRPGGRLFVRDAHPVLNSVLGQVVGAEHPDRVQQEWITGPGSASPALELPYFEQAEPMVWRDEIAAAGGGSIGSPPSVEWNHGLAEIVMAVLDAGLDLRWLAEHDSIPWDAMPGLMVADDHGEYRLAERPERLPASFTLIATLPG